MDHQRTADSKLQHRLLLLAIMMGVTALGGCCSTADHTVAIVTAVNDVGVCMGHTNDSTYGVGDTVRFINNGDTDCTVKVPSFAYVEGKSFKVKPHECKKVTISPNAAGKTIVHDIECGTGDHGAPQMIVKPRPSSDD